MIGLFGPEDNVTNKSLRKHWRDVNELANDWDGYTGTMPKSNATAAEVLRNYGYNIAAWGKWHNSLPLESTAAGPFEHWPRGYGFEYFYGFLGGEASQWEPQLVWLQPDRAAQRDDHAGAGRLSLLSSMRHFSDSRVGSTLWRPDTYLKRAPRKRVESSDEMRRVKHGCFEDFVFSLFATAKHPWS